MIIKIPTLVWVFLSELYQYKFHDVAIEELQKIHRIFPDIIPSTGTYSELFWRTNSILFISMHYKPDCSCYWFQRLLTAPRKICWNWSGTSRSNTKVGVNSWHQRLFIETIVRWWQLLCHKVAPTTSPFSSGCWTLSPSLLPYVSWDPRLTWLSGRASTWMLEDGSSCRDSKTGIM